MAIIFICKGRARFLVEGDYLVNGAYEVKSDAGSKLVWPKAYPKNKVHYERIVEAPKGTDYTDILNKAQVLIDKGEL